MQIISSTSIDIETNIKLRNVFTEIVSLKEKELSREELNNVFILETVVVYILARLNENFKNTNVTINQIEFDIPICKQLVFLSLDKNLTRVITDLNEALNCNLTEDHTDEFDVQKDLKETFFEIIVSEFDGIDLIDSLLVDLYRLYIEDYISKDYYNQLSFFADTIKFSNEIRKNDDSELLNSCREANVEEIDKAMKKDALEEPNIAKLELLSKLRNAINYLSTLDQSVSTLTAEDISKAMQLNADSNLTAPVFLIRKYMMLRKLRQFIIEDEYIKSIFS